MPGTADITILVHEDAKMTRSSLYILAYLWKGWEARGHTVRVAQGVDEWVPGDVVFVHVDLTVVPDEYLEFAARFPVAVNGGVRDLSKHQFSTLMLRPGDRWAGRVIVKTKANYGGHVDLPYGQRTAELLLHEGRPERPWRKRQTLDPYDYPVFDSLHDVPPGVWRNPYLMVEKFMPERNEEGLYVMRNWFFLGESGFVRKVSSPYHIVKPLTHGDDSGRECYLERANDPIPDEVWTLRRQMGFDYGRFDYVEVNGRPFVFDVNTTPVIVEEGLQMFAPEFEALVGGIDGFISMARRPQPAAGNPPPGG